MEVDLEQVASAVSLIKQGFAAGRNTWNNRAKIATRAFAFAGRFKARITEAARKDWRTYADMRLRYRIALTAFMVNYLAAFAWDIIAGQPPMWMTVIPTLGFVLTVSYVGYLGIKRAVSAKRCLSVR